MDALEYLRKQIRQRMNDVTDTIATGGAQDFADYKRMVGFIEGLATVERDLLDLLEKLDEA